MTTSQTYRQKLDEVRAYWDRRPCNVRHSTRQPGTRAYVEEVAVRRYHVEPQIPRFADFERWAGRRVLEVGCGIGTDAIQFALAGARVTAVDLSPASLDLAGRGAASLDVEGAIDFHQANAERLTDLVPPSPHDLVYSFGVIHHTVDPAACLRQMRAYCHAGTCLKVMVYHRYAWKWIEMFLRHGRQLGWKFEEVVRDRSEAQTGCPITHVYNRREAHRLLAENGFEIERIEIDHIFPYRIGPYKEGEHVDRWFFRVAPNRLERLARATLGQHLLITATPTLSWGALRPTAGSERGQR